jgi:hypothetical protein
MQLCADTRDARALPPRARLLPQQHTSLGPGRLAHRATASQHKAQQPFHFPAPDGAREHSLLAHNALAIKHARLLWYAEVALQERMPCKRHTPCTPLRDALAGYQRV